MKKLPIDVLRQGVINRGNLEKHNFWKYIVKPENNVFVSTVVWCDMLVDVCDEAY